MNYTNSSRYNFDLSDVSRVTKGQNSSDEKIAPPLKIENAPRGPIFCIHILIITTSNTLNFILT